MRNAVPAAWMIRQQSGHGSPSVQLQQPAPRREHKSRTETIVERDPKKAPFGLAHWMERVLEEVDGARRELAADRVHDLRVALRRCRSMAERFMAMDPDKTWRALRQESRQLFKRLGRLRDVQVLQEWISRLGKPEEPVSVAMLVHLGESELDLKRAAAAAVQEFNCDKWRGWIGRLQERARGLPEGGSAFQLGALQAWNEAHELHKQAVRDRSPASYHRLRIGIKRFRYTVENFLPVLHGEWGPDLKEIQDCLGEVHDLFVFWHTALRLRAFPDSESRERWRALINEETAKRLQQYRSKMVGRHSLWNVWRQGLPARNRLPSMSLNLIEKWASFHGIDLARVRHVRRLALQLCNGLRRGKYAEMKSRRAILHFAAILHEFGRAKRRKAGGLSPARLLLNLPSTPGFTAEALQCVAIVVCCHRGKHWNFESRELAALPEERRRLVTELCGILRLARVLSRGSRQKINSLKVEQDGNSIVILASDYSEASPLAEKLARARYLLESACQRPVIIRNNPAGRLTEAGSGSSSEVGSEPEDKTMPRHNDNAPRADRTPELPLVHLRPATDTGGKV